MTTTVVQTDLASQPSESLAVAVPASLDQLVEGCALVTGETLVRARLVQAETGERFAAIVTRLGLVSEAALASAAAHATGLPLVTGADYDGLPVAADRVSERFLREFKAAVLRCDGDVCDVAVVDPFDPYPASAIGLVLGVPVRVSIGRSSDIEAALDRAYGPAASTRPTIDAAADEADLERLKDLASDAPAIRAINRLITTAVEQRSSDIHLEASEDGIIVRFRIDGEMRTVETLPAAIRAPLVSRIKIMAGLNIAERRLPQDGRLRLAVRGHDIDLRVATTPTINGESAVLRLLDRSNLTLDFAALGFDAAVLGKLRDTLALPNGIVLATGPTGSGKTTTLYAALAELNTPQRKVLTIEDPIEYRLAGINQMQVNPSIGLDFATALRSFLRQDPDVIMVGEIRDAETAQVAVQAALTGHMILATLHTNTAASAVTRLLDMGVEPFLIASTLSAVLAQRLVRRLCPTCREAFTPAVPVGDVTTFYRAVGCSACDHSGYRGRIALVEFLVVDPVIAKLVLARAEARDLAAASSATSMFADGLAKVRAGLTTIEEVLRVTRENGE